MSLRIARPVRPELTLGDPMTTDDIEDESLDLDSLPDSDLDPDPTVSYQRTRREAEGLLRLAAEAVELKHGVELATIPDARLLAMATVGAGFAQLATIDAAAEQTNRLASLVGELLTRRGVAGKPDLVIDDGDDIWLRQSKGAFSCVTNLVLGTHGLAKIREMFGPCRYYALLPPRPGG